MSTENKYKNMVCLYIFTHNITGLKYFGKTTNSFSEERLLKYGGSGSYWNDHKKVHGNYLSVEIYGIFHKGKVKEEALKFSKDNDIVNEKINGKKTWANEEVENGLDGCPKGYKQSKEHRKNKSLAFKGIPRSEKTKRKISEKQKGIPKTEENKKNMSIGQRNRKPLTCPHCSKEGMPNNMKRWHFDNCKFK